MKRRYYLGTIAAAALAGCSELQPEEAPEETPEPEPSPEETPESEPAPDETPAPDDPEPTPEDEPPSDAEQFAESRIQSGDEQLREALSAYADAGNSESFLDVRASTTGFRWVPVYRHVQAANEQFARAANRGTAAQRTRVDTLRRVGALLTEMARTQERVATAFESFGDIVVAHQGDTVSPVAWRRLDERMATIDTRFDRLTDAGDPSDADASDHVSADELANKTDQLAAERDAFHRLLDARETYTQAHDDWIRGERLYRRRSWTSAEQRFDQAASAFEDASERLAADPVDDRRFDTRYQTFVRMAEALAEAATEYGASAAAYRDRDTETGDGRRRDGRRILRNEDVIDGLPSVRRLEAFEP
ncbi:probable secreted glycoprotein [Natronomonas pharaonis DSM 2160]|uniref:Probable secreted glycoprotein n=1 Tax=Natronomonas pharaonis (strain ATCC 35678 / DSM 2160 / CIP 103997 / JCM 8858 / NBRC 14720 / NCIMB 2260 / Gabara) TaxID=348780 RepID=A0A1U7EYH3_NATPD|nr:hypothetical protein [Natronomonas pharaonis]CAI50287.1 probable secreted glycoprotein [Natronomonas pharaonis DSM 2160]